eukprot:CAMPEP_0170486996 /NCGR_PEP_ID=MMETSP0208-20121228/5873_1 /TAXON_ID=197538 /ORGANISM="Strombidium inclinatum, Strain S3" /LENGTH=104 /DNA_ID=CAMNT_0010761097 /DNA_START=489 /DNA_END=803 /DNA_ORIENTATION=-
MGVTLLHVVHQYRDVFFSTGELMKALAKLLVLLPLIGVVEVEVDGLHLSLTTEGSLAHLLQLGLVVVDQDQVEAILLELLSELNADGMSRSREHDPGALSVAFG